MKKRRLTRRSILVLLAALLVYIVFVCWRSFPIISGYGAKILCSAIFVEGRNEQQVRHEDLAVFPLGLGHFTVDYTDSSVTGSILGLARKKAIFRKGLGATIISELSEQQVRDQHFHLAVPPAVRADTIPWPMGDQLKDTVPAGMDMAALRAAIDSAFVENDPKHLARTRAVIVLYKGQLVGERYAPGFTKDTRLLGWSMTKSVTGALIGMLVKDAKLNENDPAPVPEWKDPADPRHAITLKDLLQQCSGLEFEENYAHSSNATRMLYQRADMGAYTASRPLKDPPGSVWYYSSGNSNILSRIVRQTVGDSSYHAFPYERLFHKLGMYSAILEPDASGTFVGSSYMYATARDWARFGLFYLNDGISNRERLLPEGWVARAVQPVAPAPLGQYGYQIWLNAGAPGNTSRRLFPHAPTDLIYADGYEGQSILIIPSAQMVVVRLGLTEGPYFDIDRFVVRVLQSVRK